MASPKEFIDDELVAFIQAQRMFFVATAPLASDGLLNLSPKGHDSFRVLSPTSVAYLDMTGSGNETSAHLLENGRIVFMFCAFDGKPNILRLWGRGRTVLPTDPEWEPLAKNFVLYQGTRQIIVADITRVQTSCGYSIPRFDFVEDRDTLLKWAEKKGADRLETYRREKNTLSIEGLPTPLGQRNTG
jgi:hypothetical protein